MYDGCDLIGVLGRLLAHRITAATPPQPDEGGALSEELAQERFPPPLLAQDQGRQERRGEKVVCAGEGAQPDEHIVKDEAAQD